MSQFPPHVTVMLVEDIPAMRLLVRQMLRNLGIHKVVEAADGSSALQMLQEQAVDLILSDWNMIPMTGLQLLMAVRDTEQYRHIPFVMVTGQQATEHVRRAVSAGVSGYLVKPFGMDALARQLTRVLGGRPPPPSNAQGQTGSASFV